ncbi:MAG TPA: hypothetical protein VF284_07605 [Rhodanobacteraceae bacterium]
MAGTFFEYFDGYIRVGFANGRWSGNIFVYFFLYGDVVAATTCDDDFVKGNPDIHVKDNVSIHTWTSNSMSAFFLAMIHWLEAVLCDVHECAFRWDGEGPEGELRWFNWNEGSGRLKVSWSGNHRSPAAEKWLIAHADDEPQSRDASHERP